MISYTEGNILHSRARIIVIPVNCVGTMGKGLAAQFKAMFPDGNREYQKACRRGQLTPGHVAWHLSSPIICFFPTKDDWRQPSELEYIEKGLEDLKANLDRMKTTPVAIPKLGCGLGGLKWEDVHPLILETFRDSPYEVIVYGEPT